MSNKPEKSDPIPMEMKPHNSPWTELFHAVEETGNSAVAPAANPSETSQSERPQRPSETAGDSANPTRDALSAIFNGQ